MPIDDLSDDDSIEEIRAFEEKKLPPIIRTKSAWINTSPSSGNHEDFLDKRKQRASIHDRDDFKRRIGVDSLPKETFLPDITPKRTITQTRTQKFRSEIRETRKTLYNLEDIQTRLSEKTSSESSLSSEESTGSFLPSIKKR